MTTRYCHGCSASRGLLPALPSSLTGSSYQLDKFIKHTTPPVSGSIVSIFDDPSYSAYATYSVDAVVSGSVEVDAAKRTNVTWVASKQVGTLFHAGVLQGGVDAVKVVLPYDGAKVHAFPTSSLDLRASTCADCGGPIVY
jgi:hypothetical protein